MDKHRDLAIIQNGVYAYLRKESPTPKQMLETRSRIKLMESIWIGMDFSLTPKAHAVFAHAADDQQKFGGIGDKVEDPIEKRHQTQAQYDHMLQRHPGGGKGILKCQATYEWMYSDPGVNRRLHDVRSKQNKRERVSQRNRLVKTVVAKAEEDACGSG